VRWQWFLETLWRSTTFYIPPAMTRRVDRERSILGTELEEPKKVAPGGGEGKGSASKT
jgi:hypothetical protein